jgi:hypothetical protein
MSNISNLIMSNIIYKIVHIVNYIGYYKITNL